MHAQMSSPWRVYPTHGKQAKEEKSNHLNKCLSCCRRNELPESFFDCRMGGL
jgi:hypothetical protein